MELRQLSVRGALTVMTMLAGAPALADTVVGTVVHEYGYNAGGGMALAAQGCSWLNGQSVTVRADAGCASVADSFDLASLPGDVRSFVLTLDYLTDGAAGGGWFVNAGAPAGASAGLQSLMTGNGGHFQQQFIFDGGSDALARMIAEERFVFSLTAFGDGSAGGQSFRLRSATLQGLAAVDELAVPEPGTLALTLAAFGGLALVAPLRRGPAQRRRA